MTLADLLHDLSVQSSKRLTAARSHGWDMREETITENLIVDMLDAASGNIYIHKTTVAEENALGPDWLWALQIRGYWLTLWVQAKKASGDAALEYKSLAGKEAKQQVLKLMVNADAYDAVPMYAFFNPAEDPYGGTTAKFGRCSRAELRMCPEGLPWKGHTPPGCTVAGVTVADAIEVAQNAIFSKQAGRRRAGAVNDYAMPWECLVCPLRSVGSSTGRANTPAHRSLLRALRYLRSGPDQLDDQLPRGITRGLPGWAGRVAEGQDPWADDFEEEDQPTYAIVTFADDDG